MPVNSNDSMQHLQTIRESTEVIKELRERLDRQNRTISQLREIASELALRCVEAQAAFLETSRLPGALSCHADNQATLAKAAELGIKPY